MTGSVRTLWVGAAVLALAQGPREASADINAESSTARRQYAVGYMRGTGLGYYGASLAMAASPRVTPELHVFGFYDDGQRGMAVAPGVQLAFLEGYRNTPYIAGGVQYMQLWFGDVSGRGVGGFVTLGFEIRTQIGLAIQLGVGLHGRERIEGRDGAVMVSQRGNIGPHWDAGVRYWF